MQLNHLNLIVSDLAAACDFFCRYFDFAVLATKGSSLAVLQGQAQFSLVLSQQNELPQYPAGFHVGFVLASSAAVDACFSRLQADYAATLQQPHSMRGSYGFYFEAPSAILIEVSTPL
ncbi:VOC family protein [Herpetosiphon giganteus]|uniref:VOC family protein n=1 Tax=Herpetosiphon giganteus TaxID=2029754 RepID=UPI001956606C|nr:VOC family protein [Herpetosiphon giganteus]MBM7843025.1 catechol 2,3-dioxygenase-like lactoylglutathione lyase family enzyme [Herpetosiphon giganteus]